MIAIKFSHQLDILIHIFGAPNYVNGFSENQSQINEVADITFGQLIFNKDIIFNGIWSFNSHPDQEVEQCEIVGSKGKIVFSFFVLPIFRFRFFVYECFFYN